MQKLVWLIVTFLFMPSVGFALESCEDNLVPSGMKVIVRLVSELHPQAFASTRASTSPEELYLKMKWAEAYPPDTQELRDNLMLKRSRQYDIEQMSDQELQQFYQNALRTLYVRVADQWRKAELQSLTGSTLSHEVQEIAGHILDQYFRPWNLDSEELTFADARDYFQQRNWSELSWVSMIPFLEQWAVEKPVDHGSSDFTNFWEQRAHEYELSSDLYLRVMRAIGRVGHRERCCHSQPGCAGCPHNRRWLKKP